MMEIEAKISAPNNKTKLWIFEWDKSKYRILGKRVQIVVGALFIFFLSYTCIAVMDRVEVGKKSEVNSPAMHQISSMPEAKPAQTVKPKTSGARRADFSTKKESYSGPQVIFREAATIPPGTTIAGKLSTGASDGPVKARLTQDVTVNGERLIESGSTLIGTGTSTEERLFIRFDRLVKSDGTTISIQAQALDGKDRMAGLKGDKVGTEMSKLGAGIALNFVGGMSEGLQETEVKGGTAVKSSSLKNALLNGATHAALDQSKELISSYRDKAPRIEVEKGRVLYVMFDSITTPN